MLFLLLIILVVFVFLTVFLWVGTLFIQGYVYSEPAEHLEWRAPAAGGALALFLGLWMLLDYAAIDTAVIDIPYHTIFHFNPTQTKDVDKLWGVVGDKETLYNRQKSVRGADFFLTEGETPWQRETPDGICAAILIEEGGVKVRFEPRLVDGKFPPPKKRGLIFESPGTENFPTYYEKDGRRYMEAIGKVSIYRWLLFLLNLFLNALHLGLWFVCLWLLLRFQWTHALSGAVLIWLVMSLAVLPLLLGQTYEAAKARGTSSPRALAPDTNRHLIGCHCELPNGNPLVSTRKVPLLATGKPGNQPRLHDRRQVQG